MARKPLDLREGPDAFGRFRRALKAVVTTPKPTTAAKPAHKKKPVRRKPLA